QPLTRLAKLADASIKDVDAARRAMEEARLVMAPTRALCNIIIAEPLEPKIHFQPENWEREKHQIHRSQAAVDAASARRKPRVKWASARLSSANGPIPPFCAGSSLG